MTEPVLPPVLEKATLEQIASVAAEEEESLTPNQVAAVIAAYHNVTGGDPVGTIRRNPDNGAIAMKVNDNGLMVWRVNVPDGSHYTDAQPTLPWPIFGT